ncbi:MAG: sulfotransferase [Sneathiellales bacterium]|nr:sulfotransferase [Sneathiellales bacterium]
MSSPSLLVIASGSSSGSHLLARLLCHYPPICAGPELQILSQPSLVSPDTYHQTLEQGLRNRSEFSIPFIHPTKNHMKLVNNRLISNRRFYGCEKELDKRRLMEKTTSFQEFLQRLKENLSQTKGWPQDAIIVDHAPMSSIGLPEASKAIPDLKCIHIVRDLRDVLASMRQRRSISRQFEEFTSTEMDDFTAQQWCLLNNSANQIENSSNYVRIRYEELVLNPRKTVADALSAISLDFPFHAQRDTSVKIEIKKQEGWKNSPNQKVSNKSINRFRDELSKEEVNHIFTSKFTFEAPYGTLCPADLQKSYGYPTDFEPTAFT